MKIVIIGKNGQLGWELQRTVPEGIDFVALSSAELDITNSGEVAGIVGLHSPNIVINAAAYTAVDTAESDVDRAFAINAEGPANLANAALGIGARLVHVSTDFVFDGQKSSPYLPEDETNPTGVYGASKLAGEHNIKAINSFKNCAVLRTAWVYSAHGNNFVKTMLRLMRARDQLGVVADQVGSPTWANGLAHAVWRLALSDLNGMYHWTDAGVASWYDFAVAIMEEGVSLGLLEHEIVIRPLQTKEYPTPAQRPPYSVLDKTASWSGLGMPPVHWRKALRGMMAELVE